MNDTFGIPLTFSIFAFVLLWLLIFARGHWLFKLAITTACVYFTACLWHSLNTLEGWPTTDSFPEKFEVQWISATPPNMSTGNPGGIFVMAKNLDPKSDTHMSSPYLPMLHSKWMLNEPRIYKMPYSKGSHQEADNIQKQIRAGKRFFASMKDGKMGAPGDKQGNGKGNGKGGKGNGTGKDGKKGGNYGNPGIGHDQEGMFYQLPPPSYPSKTPNQE